jgi:hypothetical protein
VSFLLKYHQKRQETEHRKNKKREKTYCKKEKKEGEKEKLQESL